MSGFKYGFAIIRLVLTILGAIPLFLVLSMVGYAVIIEGESLFDGGPGANIGLTLLKLVLIINAPIWTLWLIPPYTIKNQAANTPDNHVE